MDEISKNINNYSSELNARYNKLKYSNILRYCCNIKWLIMNSEYIKDSRKIILFIYKIIKRLSNINYIFSTNENMLIHIDNILEKYKVLYNIHYASILSNPIYGSKCQTHKPNGSLNKEKCSPTCGIYCGLKSVELMFINDVTNILEGNFNIRLVHAPLSSNNNYVHYLKVVNYPFRNSFIKIIEDLNTNENININNIYKYLYHIIFLNKNTIYFQNNILIYYDIIKFIFNIVNIILIEMNLSPNINIDNIKNIISFSSITIKKIIPTEKLKNPNLNLLQLQTPINNKLSIKDKISQIANTINYPYISHLNKIFIQIEQNNILLYTQIIKPNNLNNSVINIEEELNINTLNISNIIKCINVKWLAINAHHFNEIYYNQIIIPIYKSIRLILPDIHIGKINYREIINIMNLNITSLLPQLKINTDSIIENNTKIDDGIFNINKSIILRIRKKNIVSNIRKLIFCIKNLSYPYFNELQKELLKLDKINEIKYNLFTNNINSRKNEHYLFLNNEPKNNISLLDYVNILTDIITINSLPLSLIDKSDCINILTKYLIKKFNISFLIGNNLEREYNHNFTSGNYIECLNIINTIYHNSFKSTIDNISPYTSRFISNKESLIDKLYDYEPYIKMKISTISYKVLRIKLDELYRKLYIIIKCNHIIFLLKNYEKFYKNHLYNSIIIIILKSIYNITINNDFKFKENINVLELVYIYIQYYNSKLNKPISESKLIDTSPIVELNNKTGNIIKQITKYSEQVSYKWRSKLKSELENLEEMLLVSNNKISYIDETGKMIIPSHLLLEQFNIVTKSPQNQSTLLNLPPSPLQIQPNSLSLSPLQIQPNSLSLSPLQIQPNSLSLPNKSTISILSKKEYIELLIDLEWFIKSEYISLEYKEFIKNRIRPILINQLNIFEQEKHEEIRRLLIVNNYLECLILLDVNIRRINWSQERPNMSIQSSNSLLKQLNEYATKSNWTISEITKIKLFEGINKSLLTNNLFGRIKKPLQITHKNKLFLKARPKSNIHNKLSTNISTNKRTEKSNILIAPKGSRLKASIIKNIRTLIFIKQIGIYNFSLPPDSLSLFEQATHNYIRIFKDLDKIKLVIQITEDDIYIKILYNDKQIFHTSFHYKRIPYELHIVLDIISPQINYKLICYEYNRTNGIKTIGLKLLDKHQPYEIKYLLDLMENISTYAINQILK